MPSSRTVLHIQLSVLLLIRLVCPVHALPVHDTPASQAASQAGSQPAIIDQPPRRGRRWRTAAALARLPQRMGSPGCRQQCRRRRLLTVVLALVCAAHPPVGRSQDLLRPLYTSGWSCPSASSSAAISRTLPLPSLSPPADGAGGRAPPRADARENYQGPRRGRSGPGLGWGAVQL